MYKVYELKENGEVGKLLDITDNLEKWKQKFRSFEVLVCCPGLFNASK